MFDVFMDIFTYRDSALRRVDARIKLTAMLAAVLVVILSARPFLPLSFFALSISFMLGFGMPGRLLLLRMLVPAGVAVMLGLLQSLLIGSTPAFSWNVAGWHISMYTEGITHGILLGSRVLGATSIILLLSSSTPAHEIFHALRWMKVPADWVEIAMLMYRYTFILIDLASDMSSAQRLRLGYSRMDRALASAGNLAGTVIIRAADQALRTHEAMLLRGYDGKLAFGPMPPLGIIGVAKTFGCILMLTGLYYLAGRN